MQLGFERGIVDDDQATAWQHDAECLKYAGLVDFFPARGESGLDAKAICTSCTVQQSCLDFALRLRIVHGVWGGLDERERRRLRRARHRSER